MERCGKIEPGTAATDSSSNRNSAVRIDVRLRHAQRAQPSGPSCGLADLGLALWRFPTLTAPPRIR
jgi:hypothetical protein